MLVPWVFDYYTKLNFSPAHKTQKIHALRMVSASSALSSLFCYRGLARYATVALASILDPFWGLFSAARTALSAVRSLLWRKRVPRKSRLETKPENEAPSALLARLWCHLILQNRANGAENLTRLCSATIGQTGWRMVQSRAIRSRQKVFWQFWESGSNFWPCAWLGQCSENSEKP